ncbi:MAG: hypothetical protein H6524_07860 [Actinobacteria bacterium]|nr:hypothetical protein [Micrococcales bacterium]MCB0903109.1 hypothetical protein [Actinomycetota bacterium]MCO5298797.1 hypothetical protein [Candidatus Nanopelagicales bacterium]MCB9428707.1 hypothetical protein [Actinomycetota bacterium]HPE12154.1 hypothetical protein [Actinomycetota bacterium]
MRHGAPAGWPADLPPVGAGFDEQVVGWLLDRLPPEYRTSPLRSQPLILALAARRHAQATLDGTREVYRELRAELRDHLDPAQIDGGLVALEALAAAFTRTVREVTMVEQGMRGHVWKPRL